MKRGFTLLELIIVIAIIGILGTLGYKGYTYVTTQSNAKTLADQLRQISAAMGKYYADTGSYPANLELLIRRPEESDTGYDAIALALGSEGSAQEDVLVKNNWKGPYVDNMEISKSAKGCIRAKVGDAICFGAIVNDNDTFTESTTAANGLFVSNGAFNASNKPSRGSGNGGDGNLYNVLSVNGLETSVAQEVFKELNGKDVSILKGGGNLTDTADGNYTVGLPKPQNFAQTKRLIFRYRSLY